MTKKYILLVGFLLSLATSACADLISDINGKYSSEAYLVGIGTSKLSGNIVNDRRSAEIFARLEIAKTIKVRVKEHSVDFMCSSQGQVIYSDRSECKNEFSMLVEQSVDQVLVGSTVVESGEDKANGRYVAVAILPRLQAAQKAGDAALESRANVQLHLAKAKSAELATEKVVEIAKAKEEIKKVMAYAGEKSAIEDSIANVDAMYGDLMAEISKLKSN